MSKRYKKVAIIGHFGFGEELFNGQTVKTKIVARELEKEFGENKILKMDTSGGIKSLLCLPFTLWSALAKSENVVILPAENGLRVIAPILVIENLFLKRKLHYAVVGGWLPKFVLERNLLKTFLKKFTCIYVEANTMLKELEKQGFTNVTVMPNFKDLKTIDETELVYPQSTPYKLCTFSRVMKEKGIEDAVEAVKYVNAKNEKVTCTLDIYGQIDSNQTEWFKSLEEQFPSYVKYCGVVEFDKSTEVLKDYFALLFPTYYEGEGFAGTIIDAMAAGIPVIASDWRYNAEIIKEGKTGFIYPAHGVKDLCFVLLECLDKVEMTYEMKKDILAEAQEYFPDKVMKILIERL